MTTHQITACDHVDGSEWLCAVTSPSDPSAPSAALEPTAPAAFWITTNLPVLPVAGWAAAGAAVGVVAVFAARAAWTRYAAARDAKRAVTAEVVPTGEAHWRWAVSVPSINGLYTQASRLRDVPAAVVDAARALGVYVKPKDVRVRVVTPEPTTTPPNPPPFTVPDGMGGFRPYNPDPDAFPPLPDGARYWHDVRADRERMDAEGVREVDTERADSEPIAADDLWDEDEYAAYAATLEPVNLDEPSAAKGDADESEGGAR